MEKGNSSKTSIEQMGGLLHGEDKPMSGDAV